MASPNPIRVSGSRMGPTSDIGSAVAGHIRKPNGTCGEQTEIEPKTSEYVRIHIQEREYRAIPELVKHGVLREYRNLARHGWAANGNEIDDMVAEKFGITGAMVQLIVARAIERLDRTVSGCSAFAKNIVEYAGNSRRDMFSEDAA